MFGAVKPCKKCLSKQEWAAYRQHYCGLCFALHENFGKLGRLLINYDLTNAYLISGSSRADGQVQQGVCPWSMWRKRVSYITYPQISDYYAQLNYLLVYYHLLDDVQDDGSLVAKWITGKMKDRMEQLDTSMQREKQLYQQYLQQMTQVEQCREKVSVMAVARLFGQLLQDMVKPGIATQTDEEVFSGINYWAGIWIYTIDAIADCLSDGYKKRYNPILAGYQGTPLRILRSRKQELLDILFLCRQNILLLLELYPTYDNARLLRQLFEGELPKIVCMYLEVEKNELIAQSEAAAAGKLQ